MKFFGEIGYLERYVGYFEKYNLLISGCNGDLGDRVYHSAVV